MNHEDTKSRSAAAVLKTDGFPRLSCLRVFVVAVPLAFGGCARPARAPGDAAFQPPAGKRAFSLSIDKSQVLFLEPGDAVEVVVLADSPRADGGSESRSEVVAPRAEVLRVSRDWGEDSGLVQLALTPEEAQYAALAAAREDRVFLNESPEPASLSAVAPPGKPRLEAGHRGLAVLVYPDQQEFLAPGDRVDVVAVREGLKAKSELTAATVLQDVLVLGAAPPEGNEEWSTVQLMLEPRQVETLTRAVAAEDGLALPVRAAGDRATAPVEPSRMSRRLGPAAGRSATRS